MFLLLLNISSTTRVLSVNCRWPAALDVVLLALTWSPRSSLCRTWTLTLVEKSAYAVGPPQYLQVAGFWHWKLHCHCPPCPIPLVSGTNILCICLSFNLGAYAIPAGLHFLLLYPILMLQGLNSFSKGASCLTENTSPPRKLVTAWAFFR
jgi:hypothetical protein